MIDTTLGQNQNSRIQVSGKLHRYRPSIELLQDISRSHDRLDQIWDSVFQNRVQEQKRKETRGEADFERPCTTRPRKDHRYNK